jgi:hypothetical protein
MLREVELHDGPAKALRNPDPADVPEKADAKTEKKP